jgi:hypothetical protein
MRSYASAALILLSAHLAIAPRASAQSASYRALVQSYRELGAETNALRAISREAVVAAVDQAISRDNSWPWEELRAAAMLHSETCVTAADKGSTCEFQIMQAERLLERTMRLSPRQEDFAWRWYHVMARVLDSLGQKSLARGIETQAAQKWHLDLARAAYLQGLELESRGSHEPVELRVTGSSAYDTAGARASHFAQAGELFTRALQQRPDLTVAALHLGRVRMLQGNGSEARTLFQSALTDVDPSVRYLAALFLGSLEEREGRFDGAEKLYRDAMQYMPYGQSAPLALSELLSRTGRETEARSALTARVLRMNAQVVEPFWTYGPDGDTATEFDLLRVEVWK